MHQQLPRSPKKTYRKHPEEASSRIFYTCAMCHVCVWEATYRVPCLLAARVFFLLFLALSLSVCRRSPLFSFRSCLSAFSAASRPSRHASRSMRCLYVCTTRGELRHRHARTPPAPTRPHTPHRSIKPEATPWRHTGAAPTLHKATAQRVLALRRRAAWDKETHATTMTTTTRHTRAHAHDTARMTARGSRFFFSLVFLFRSRACACIFFFSNGLFLLSFLLFSSIPPREAQLPHPDPESKAAAAANAATRQHQHQQQ